MTIPTRWAVSNPEPGLEEIGKPESESNDRKCTSEILDAVTREAGCNYSLDWMSPLSVDWKIQYQESCRPDHSKLKEFSITAPRRNITCLLTYRKGSDPSCFAILVRTESRLQMEWEPRVSGMGLS